MRIGIIASSGGSVFAELYKIFRTNYNSQVQFAVVTDRECGIESFCKTEAIDFVRIEDKNKTDFSVKALAYFQSFDKIDCIFLFFLRLISKELFLEFPVINFHPSLLPSYTGFNAISRLITDKGKFLGSTAHLVNDEPDQGRIIAQVSRPVNANELNPDTLNKISFLQKVYLALVVAEMFLADIISVNKEKTEAFYKPGVLSYNNNCNPLLSDKGLINSFGVLENREAQRISV